LEGKPVLNLFLGAKLLNMNETVGRGAIGKVYRTDEIKNQMFPDPGDGGGSILN